VADMAWAFNTAKGLSDFIGMIVYLTFAWAFVIYFVEKSSAAPSWWVRHNYATAAFFTAIIALYLVFLLGRVIIEYFMYLASVARHPWVRVLSVALALYCYWAVSTSIWDISVRRAQATKVAQ
jgi:hypothetical protein